MWRRIEGYKHPYRINEQGEVQRFRWGRWMPMKIHLENRAEVRLRGLDGKQKQVGVFRLLDECFCGGYARKNGLCVGPKNGVKMDCTLENMAYRRRSEIGRKSMERTMRKPVIRYDRNGEATAYGSIREAARKNGMTEFALGRRLYGGVLDPRGYRFEVDQ